MTERPGIMLYFDMAEPLKAIGYDDKGKLLEAMLEYGQYGVVPAFEGNLMIAWGFIRPKLDADAKRYRRTVAQKTHASYCAKEKRANRIPLDFEEWCEKQGYDSEWNHMESPDTNRYPTANTAAPTSPNKDSSSYAAGDEDRKGYVKGKKEEEPTREEEFEALRREKLAMLDVKE